MKHSHSARVSARALLAVSALAFAVACADSISGPSTEVHSSVPAQFNRARGIVAFKYDPAKRLVARFGGHALDIPAGAVCDLATSKYGPAYWDAPCSPQSTPIIITVTMFEDKFGHPAVDFQPALRFVPTKVVNLILKDIRGAKNATATVFYCNGIAACFDESKVDASLEPRRNGRSGYIVRRVKHFTGYNVGAGRECLPEDLPEDCIDIPEDTGEGGEDGGGVGNGRSGYMVASGLTKKGGSTVVGKKITTEKKNKQ